MDFGVHIAVIRDGAILLTQRDDVEAWVLPGGTIDPGETVAETAVREAREETGLEVELTGLVGIYAMPPDHHSITFSARVTGGALAPQPGEVIDLGFYSPNALPDPLAWWHEQRIQDALAGIGGSRVWVQRHYWPFDRSVKLGMLGDMAAQEGLSKQDFFRRHFARPAHSPDDVEERVL